ncbi:CynX/NimT family MFS transporter [Corticicoccus populi]|uniref:CynX/NimT family MFS transporter n=1 Tax=Corticicoccus populi TaxID=1812821 RepID=A0ABW5WVC6_9STAP
MKSTADHQNTVRNTSAIILVIGILIVASNLRPAITSVGPVIGIIRDDIGISNGAAGLLTSLPLVAFALISPVVPKLARTFSKEQALIIGFVLIIAGAFVRSTALFFLLLIGTLIVGAGIAICNVLLPSIIKDRFPLKVGLMTSVYTTTLSTCAAIGSGFSYPLTTAAGLGWQLSLLVWTVPAVIGIIVWMVILKKYTPKKTTFKGKTGGIFKGNLMWGDKLAWIVAAYLGLQSILFYVTVSWLPEILNDSGIEMQTAGWLLSFTLIIGIPGSFFLPIIAAKMQKQSILGCLIGMMGLTGYTLVLFGSSMPVLITGLVLVGITLGGGFALALTFISLRAKNADHATELSGMSQSIGYLLAASGPFVIGSIYDFTETWTVPLIVLMSVCVVIVIVGYQVGRDRYVLNK